MFAKRGICLPPRPVTLEADPGQARSAVDGQRFEYSASDTDNCTCDIGTDRLTISFQTADGHDFYIQGATSATAGPSMYVVPTIGAQSVTCTVTSDLIEIRIDRLALEGTQLEINGTFDGTSWLGNVTMYTPEGNLTSTFGPDVDGPVVDGSTVTYAGPFSSETGDLEGTASVTCP